MLIAIIYTIFTAISVTLLIISNYLMRRTVTLEATVTEKVSNGYKVNLIYNFNDYNIFCFDLVGKSCDAFEIGATVKVRILHKGTIKVFTERSIRSLLIIGFMFLMPAILASINYILELFV